MQIHLDVWDTHNSITSALGGGPHVPIDTPIKGFAGGARRSIRQRCDSAQFETPAPGTCNAPDIQLTKPWPNGHYDIDAKCVLLRAAAAIHQAVLCLSDTLAKEIAREVQKMSGKQVATAADDNVHKPRRTCSTRS